MAKQAGFVDYELDDGTTDAFDKRYEAFAKLVAKKEREACTDHAMTSAEKAIDVAINTAFGFAGIIFILSGTRHD